MKWESWAIMLLYVGHWRDSCLMSSVQGSRRRKSLCLTPGVWYTVASWISSSAAMKRTNKRVQMENSKKHHLEMVRDIGEMCFSWWPTREDVAENVELERIIGSISWGRRTRALETVPDSLDLCRRLCGESKIVQKWNSCGCSALVCTIWSERRKWWGRRGWVKFHIMGCASRYMDSYGYEMFTEKETGREHFQRLYAGTYKRTLHLLWNRFWEYWTFCKVLRWVQRNMQRRWRNNERCPVSLRP